MSALMLTAFASVAQPKLKWLKTVHDFGAFKEDLGVVECEFSAVNTGTEPVTVLAARANCGCTRPEYPKTPVGPGDTLVIKTAFDAIGRPGRFGKQVKVETNAGSVNLLLKGTVIGSPNTLASRYPVETGSARLSNRVTPFGQTVKGRTLAAAVNIYNTTDRDIRPAVDSLPKYVSAVFRPEVIKRGEQGTVSLTAYTDRCPDYGVVTDRFVLIPDSEGNPDDRVPISTTVIVTEDFSTLTPKEREEAAVATLEGDMVDFSPLKVGKGDVEKTIKLTNTGHRTLAIRRLFTADPAIDVKCKAKTVAPGKSTDIVITVHTDRLNKKTPLNGRVTLITNTPSAPTQNFRVVAETK